MKNLTDIQVNQYFDFVYGWSGVRTEIQRIILRNFLNNNNLTIKDIQQEIDNL